MIRIDETKCKRDGFCVQDCPAGIISQADKDSFPEMTANGPTVCLKCGHCVAVCPHDALDHVNVPMEKSPLILKDLSITPEQASQFLRSRRSIRRFKNKPVEKQTLQYLIDNARYAPTGGNDQPLAWTVHTDRNKIKNMADLTIEWIKKEMASDPAAAKSSYLPIIVSTYEKGIDSITHDAPCLIFASSAGGYGNGLVDLTIALSYFELMAANAGLGTCWLGFIMQSLKAYEPMREAAGLPESHRHFYPLILGYPKLKYRRLPERKPAKIFWR